MKMKVVLIICFTLIGFAGKLQSKREDSSILKKVIALDGTLSNSRHQDRILLEIAKILMPIDISLEMYKDNKKYKEVCHLKVVKSVNFGDFVVYDGYHLKKIINAYPKSDLADDAAYELIHVIPGNEYNFHDVREEKAKLLDFIKKYPKSNLRQKAEERIDSIEKDLKNGGSAIYD